MNLDRYKLISGTELEIFEFVSSGPKGEIVKLVQFTETNYKGLYNLGFGDKNANTGKLDDTIISNNGDSEKVLATVIATLYAFTDKHTDVMVYATGVSKSRTRLYQIGISKYLDEALIDFEIYGEINNSWDKFRKGINYNAFLVKRK